MHRKIACLLFLLFGASLGAFAQTSLPATRLQTFVSGLNSPIYVTHAGDGSGRLFIVEREGRIKVVQPGSSTPTEFLNITALTTTSGERGLLSMAFHPGYRSNRRFFVYFTRASDGAIQISEFEASPTNPNVALTTEKPIITIPHPSANNHNGGTLNFGPDGYLYIATGDGGGANDTPNNAQNLNSLLGKMLRIDVNTPTGYLIPPTNPFAGPTPGLDEIYAYGLRNPFRWSFDRGGTRQIWLGDVGQNAWEEVDIITSGGNYGWRIMEGNVCTPSIDPSCTPPAGHIPPVFVYSSQNTSSRCSITGGYVYRGTLGTLPAGAYIYGDYCTGEILVWHNDQQIPLHDIVDFTLVSFGEDETGELYVIQAGAGIVQKLVRMGSNSDFSGDFRTDLSVYRESTGIFYTLNINNGQIDGRALQCCGQKPAAEDYDGDRVTDYAVFDGVWKFIRSSDSTMGLVNWGVATDIPVPGDYDGDGRADFAVYRESDSMWYFVYSSGISGGTRWGETGDVPVTADPDGDGRTDLTVWRPSNGRWYTKLRANTEAPIELVNEWGMAGDIPVPGDFDGDVRTDLAVFRPSTGTWYLRLSATNSFTGQNWGAAGDVPVVGDYDNDGRDDIGVWRPTTGAWYLIRSSAGLFQVGSWGVQGDIPVASRDAP